MAQATLERATFGGGSGARAERAASPLRVTFMPAEPRSSGPPTLAAAFAWAVPGFLIGTVFWHFVGFWGFVSHVVLGEVPAEQAGPTPLAAVVRADAPASADATSPASACVALALDRITGATRSKACDGRPITGGDPGPARKEDLATPRQTSAPPLISRTQATAQSGAP